MRSIIRIFLIIFLSTASSVAFAQRMLEVASNQGPHSAMLAVVFNEICRQAGFGLTIVPLPAVRASKEAGSGNFDGELARPPSYGNSNPTLIRVDPPLSPVSIVAFARESSNVQINDLQDLKKYKIGIVYGMAAIEALVVGHKDVELAPNQASLHKMLKEGRFDVAIDIGPSGRVEILKQGIKGISEFELQRQYLHVYLHEKNRDIVPIIGAAIGRLMDSGNLSKLLHKSETDYLAGIVESQ
jgi:ABC-type amino acid transport substrate-binding protein